MNQNPGPGNDAPARAATCVVISTDAGFVEDLRSSPPFVSGDFKIAAEIAASYPDIIDTDLEKIRTLAPDVVILDLESDLAIGLKFAEFLSDAGIGKVLLGSAPPQSPEALLDVMHAGISDFIPKPLMPRDVAKALKSARRRLGDSYSRGRQRVPGKVLVFFGAKGGAGCTTLSTNTGVDVHRACRKKTLLLDLDLELGETALHLGESPRFNMIDLVRNFHRVDSDLLASYIGHHDSGVDLLSAPYRPLAFEAMSGDRIAQILAFLRDQYDYLFVDAPRTLNPATIAAIQAADHLFLVTTPDLPSVRNLTRCLPLLKEIGGDRSDDWIRLVVNRFNSRELVSLKQVEETVGHPVFATVRNDYQTVMQAINKSTPAVMVGDSDFATDIRALAGKVAGMPLEPQVGWLQRKIRSMRKRGSRPRTPQTEVTNDA